jgi:hypothetical protein
MIAMNVLGRRNVKNTFLVSEETSLLFVMILNISLTEMEYLPLQMETTAMMSTIAVVIANSQKFLLKVLLTN